MTFDELLAGLTSHRDIHQQWLDHQLHCAGCPDCAAKVVEQVGDAETHRQHIAFYDGAIALIESTRQVGGVYFSPEADARLRAQPEADAAVFPRDERRTSEGPRVEASSSSAFSDGRAAAVARSAPTETP